MNLLNLLENVEAIEYGILTQMIHYVTYICHCTSLFECLMKFYCKKKTPHAKKEKNKNKIHPNKKTKKHKRNIPTKCMQKNPTSYNMTEICIINGP